MTQPSVALKPPTVPLKAILIAFLTAPADSPDMARCGRRVIWAEPDPRVREQPPRTEQGE